MKAEVLLGGKTRFTILEALADTRQPITAYQIAMTKGLDSAATYRCLAEFVEVGIVEFEIRERNQTFYKLSKGAGKAAVKFLRSLKQKTPESIDLEEWMSPQMQAERMEKVVQLNTNQYSTSTFKKPASRQDVNDLISRRVSGELSALIASSQIAFKELFERKDGIFILKTP